MTATHPSTLRRFAPHWPWAAIAASAAMLAGAHGFQQFMGLYPCALCLRQREIYWGALALAVVGLLALRFAPRPQLGRTLNVFLGLVFLTGALIALYHVAVEQGWVLAQCEGFGVEGDLSLSSGTEPIVAARCDAPSWKLFGITMAGYNALISVGLAGISFWCAVVAPVKPDLTRG